MDLPVAKAEPISDIGSAFVITYLRGKRPLHNSSWERGVRKCGRKSPADSKVSEEGGVEHASGTGAKIPLQPLMKPVAMQVVHV